MFGAWLQIIKFKISTDDSSMYCNMYQTMYVEKNFTLMGVFTNFRIGLFFFGFFLRSAKLTALGSVGLSSRNEQDRNRGDEIGTIPKKSVFFTRHQGSFWNKRPKVAKYEKQ